MDLKSTAKTHLFERVIVGQTFCNHCGHAMSFTRALKCKGCGCAVHEGCEFYLADLCKLSVSDGLRLREKYQVASKKATQLDLSSRGTGASASKTQSKTLQMNSKFSQSDFEYIAVIGKGNFGKVMLSKLRSNGQYYALKILKKNAILKNDEFESLASEKEVFMLIKNELCPFLVQCHGIFQSDTRIFFVMEYVAGGDLMYQIQKQRFTTDQAKFFAAEVFLALDFLHKRDVIYRDLKLDNILLGLDGHIKLADYGLCKLRMSVKSMTQTFCGTPEFMAPEIVEERAYGKAVDWWAFGILVYELLFCRVTLYSITL